jgi:hypothetical protein
MVNDTKAFDITILVSAVIVIFLGLKLLNKAFIAEGGKISWLMAIAVFTWLTSIMMFILFSLIVYISRKELGGIKDLVVELHKKSIKKKK